MEFLNNLSASLAEFYADFIKYNFSDWWTPFLIVFIIYILSLLGIKIAKKHKILLRPFRILSVFIIVSCITTFILIGISCYLWILSDYYVIHKTELPHLISLLLCSFFIIGAFLALRNKFGYNGIKQINAQSYTKDESSRFYGKAAKGFNLLKLWALLPILAFAMLLFVFKNPPNLVSFVIDNSSSMGANLEIGKQAIGKTIMELDKNTDIIIGTFSEGKPKDTINNIISESEYEKLIGTNYHFTDRNSAISYLNSIYTIASGTPLFESVWKNFLFSRTQASNKYYKLRYVIIISDGFDTGKGKNASTNEWSFFTIEELKDFFCTNSEFDEFYANVSFINMGGDLNLPIYSKAGECGYYIEEDGTSLYSYSSALDTILDRLKHNWYYILCMAIIYGITVLITFSIQTKRRF
jgi:hypothetical protein